MNIANYVNVISIWTGCLGGKISAK